jgi:hypothetical protein
MADCIAIKGIFIAIKGQFYRDKGHKSGLALAYGRELSPLRARDTRTRDKRIKSFWGAKPPQKLRWTNAGLWEALECYGDFTRDARCRGG